MGISGPEEDRLRAPDWRDKYRWPDPDQGWSGPLAGYPPDHPIRAGRSIPLHLIAQKYQQDEEVTRYQALGLIGSHIPEKESPWTAPAGGDTPLSGSQDAPLPLINTPEERARKLAIADKLRIKRGSSLLTKGVTSPVTPPVSVTPLVTPVEEALSNAERQRRWKAANRDKVNEGKRVARARKAGLLSGGAHVLGIGSPISGRDS